MAYFNELNTFEHTKGLYACFLVPRSRPPKWHYGVLLNNVSWDPADNLGTFLLCDGSVRTYGPKMIREAARRLIKDAQWSEFKKGFPCGRALLLQQESKIRNHNGKESKEDGENALKQLMDASVRTYRDNLPLLAVKPKKDRQPPPKSMYPPLRKKKPNLPRPAERKQI